MASSAVGARVIFQKQSRAGTPVPRFTGVWILVLLVLTVAARLPLIGDILEVRNDGAEYLAIARALAQGRGYSSDLKYHFFNPLPVQHAALGDRPPLAPLVMAPLLALFPGSAGVAAVRLLMVLLAGAALLLYIRCLTPLAGRFAAAAASGFSFLLPHSIYWTAQPMTESLTLLLTPAALLMLQRALRSETEGRDELLFALSAGGLAGLAYLVRPTGALLAAALIYGALREGRGRIAAAAALAAGLVAAPYHLLLWIEFGSPWFTTLTYTFGVVTYLDAVFYGFEKAPRPLLTLLLQEGAEVGKVLARQWAAHAEAILLPLLAPAAAWILAGRPRAGSAAHWAAPAALIVLTLAVHAVTWTAWGSSRYFLPVLPFLCAWILRPAAERSGDRRLIVAALLVGLGVALPAFYIKQFSRYHGRAELGMVEQSRRHLTGRGLIASNRPNQMNLLLERPAVALPYAPPDQLSRFARTYRPEEMLLFLGPPEESSAAAMAADWRAGHLPSGYRLTLDGSRFLIAARSGGRAR